MHLAVRLAHIVLSLYQVLGEGRAALSVRITVETDHALWLGAVAEAVVPQNNLCGILPLEESRIVEGETLDVGRERADRIIGLVEPCEYVLEHPGSRSGRRDELAPAIRLGLCGVGYGFFLLCCIQYCYALSGGCGSHYVHPRETYLETLYLFLNLFLPVHINLCKILFYNCSLYANPRSRPDADGT